MSKIPEGYTSITPYITFDDTAAAIEFYKKAFAAEELKRLSSPDGNVAHAEIKIGNAVVMVCSPCPDFGGQSAQTLGGSPVAFYVYVTDVEASFKKAKSAGMIEKKPLVDMFWGDRMGTLIDPFGVQWTIAEHIRDVSPAEMQEAMKKMAMAG